MAGVLVVEIRGVAEASATAQPRFDRCPYLTVGLGTRESYQATEVHGPRAFAGVDGDALATEVVRSFAASRPAVRCSRRCSRHSILVESCQSEQSGGVWWALVSAAALTAHVCRLARRSGMSASAYPYVHCKALVHLRDIFVTSHCRLSNALVKCVAQSSL